MFNERTSSLPGPRPLAKQIQYEHQSNPASGCSTPTSATLTDLRHDWSTYNAADDEFEYDMEASGTESERSPSSAGVFGDVLSKTSTIDTPSTAPTVASPFEATTLRETPDNPLGLSQEALDLQQQNEQRFAQLSALTNDVKEKAALLRVHLQLSAVKTSLLTPINPAAIRPGRFTDENLPPYDHRIVTLKVTELVRQDEIIAEGIQKYNTLRNLLISGLWSEAAAIEHFRHEFESIACNEERSRADHLLSTIPFQIPWSTNKKRTLQLQAEVPHIHRQWMEHAKRWRGHMRIHVDHLEVHLKIFGMVDLPELPKGVMLSCEELGYERPTELDTSILSVEEDLGPLNHLRSRRDLHVQTRDGSGGSMVKSQSKKAMQILGIPDDFEPPA